MASMQILPSKTPDTTISLSVDFLSALPPGDTISGVTVSCDVFTGTDANAADLIDGAASFTDTIVTQDIVGGVAGVVYLLSFDVTSSNDDLITIQGYLAVVGANPF